MSSLLLLSLEAVAILNAKSSPLLNCLNCLHSEENESANSNSWYRYKHTREIGLSVNMLSRLPTAILHSTSTVL